MTKNAFYTKWLETFAAAVPPQKIKKYVQSTGNYIWHVFSWELLNKDHYLTGNAAKEAFDEADKDGAQYIEWFSDHQTHDITWEMLTANALDEFVEIYVVGKDFNWTYIKTHESMCGPYFLKLK